MLVISGVGGWRQLGPWGSLASWPNLMSELQDNGMLSHCTYGHKYTCTHTTRTKGVETGEIHTPDSEC